MSTQSQSQSDDLHFVEIEHKILSYWNKHNIFAKSVEKNKNNPPFVFYDGPPFATGLPHHGHLLAGTIKDIIPRFFTMKGRYVPRRFGWDCHGLPIEQQIDQKFSMSAHEFVRKHGVSEYNNECRKIVLTYTKEWEKVTNRMGRWVDFQNDYKTMDMTFMESVWWVFRQLWDKNLIYKGHKVVPVSTTFGTVLSNFEATSNYQNIQDPSVIVKFPLLQEKNTYFLAWTTTPWTLPSNMGLCVNAKLEYSYVKLKDGDDSTFILGTNALERYAKIFSFEVLRTVSGVELKNKEYAPILPYFENKKEQESKLFRVHCDDYVSDSDGTGIVHLAASFGEDDLRVISKAHIQEFFSPIDMNGCFNEEIPSLKGLFFKDADKVIIKELKDKTLLFHQDVLAHNYPCCPRTDKPLMYKAISSWYVNVEKIKNKLIANNQEINWVPEHIKDGRFGNWLKGAKDWAIGRNRVWGTPIPIWYNETADKYHCVGSKAELEELSKCSLNDLHREFVDSLEFSLPGIEGTFKRVEEVLDCWFESGSMPYAQLHYPFENKHLFEKGFPAEFIAEGLDQTRGWFYTLCVLSAALYNRPPFKNVIVNGLILASDGKKMSKRLKNYTDPTILMEEFGADSLRLYMINSGLVRGEEMRFMDSGIKDMTRRVLLPWFNAFKFFQTYAQIDQWNFDKFELGENIFDQWILSRQQSLMAQVEAEMVHYRLYNVVPSLFNFIEDLTNWYIRLNRRRFWKDGTNNVNDSMDKNQAYSTLYLALKNITFLMAPFTPFICEHIYLELKKFGELKEESIHLCSYPHVDISFIKANLESAMVMAKEVVILARDRRIKEKIKVKTPLSELTIISKEETILNELRKLEDTLKSELNVKNIHYTTDEKKYVKINVKPNFPILGKKLGARMKEFVQLLQNPATTVDILAYEQEKNIFINTFEIEPGDLLIERVAASDEKSSGMSVDTNGNLSILLNTKLTPELIEEGLAREVVNRIQKTRKDLNLEVSDRISIHFATVDGEELEKSVLAHANYIKEETLCVELKQVELSKDEKVLSEFTCLNWDEYIFYVQIKNVALT